MRRNKRKGGKKTLFRSKKDSPDTSSTDSNSNEFSDTTSTDSSSSSSSSMPTARSGLRVKRKKQADKKKPVTLKKKRAPLVKATPSDSLLSSTSTDNLETEATKPPPVKAPLKKGLFRSNDVESTATSDVILTSSNPLDSASDPRHNAEEKEEKKEDEDVPKSQEVQLSDSNKSEKPTLKKKRSMKQSISNFFKRKKSSKRTSKSISKSKQKEEQPPKKELKKALFRSDDVESTEATSSADPLKSSNKKEDHLNVEKKKKVSLSFEDLMNEHGLSKMSPVPEQNVAQDLSFNMPITPKKSVYETGSLSQTPKKSPKRESILSIPLREVSLDGIGYRKRKSSWKPTKTVPEPFKGMADIHPKELEPRSKSMVHHEDLLEAFMFDCKFNRQYRFQPMMAMPTINNSLTFKYFFMR